MTQEPNEPWSGIDYGLESEEYDRLSKLPEFLVILGCLQEFVDNGGTNKDVEQRFCSAVILKHLNPLMLERMTKHIKEYDKRREEMRSRTARLGEGLITLSRQYQSLLHDVQSFIGDAPTAKFGTASGHRASDPDAWRSEFKHVTAEELEAELEAAIHSDTDIVAMRLT